MNSGGTVDLRRRVLLRGGNLFVCLFSVCPSLSVAFFICEGFSNSTHSDFSVVAFENANTLWSIIMITRLRKPLLSFFPK